MSNLRTYRVLTELEAEVKLAEARKIDKFAYMYMDEEFGHFHVCYQIGYRPADSSPGAEVGEV